MYFLKRLTNTQMKKYFYCHFRLSIFTFGHVVCTPFALRHQSQSSRPIILILIISLQVFTILNIKSHDILTEGHLWMCLNYTCKQTWINIKGKEDLFSEDKKRIHTSLSFNTLAKAFAGRFLMFLSVFNQTTVWRGCCDLGNNFLTHICIPNFFLNWVNQHAIWDAPGGNLLEGFLELFFFWKVRTTQHPFALEPPVNTSQSLLALRRRTKETAIFSQYLVISVFHRPGNRIEGAFNSLQGHCLW